MLEFIEWLDGLERRAAMLYGQAAVRLGVGDPLSQFCRSLAGEELQHSRLLGKAKEIVLEDPEIFVLPLSIGEAARRRLEESFDDFTRLLDETPLPRDRMLVGIAELEGSEWNDYFLFVMGILKAHSKEFQEAASEFQQHKEQIERRLEEEGACGVALERLQSRPVVWEKAVLVVDDEVALVALLESVLRRKYRVTVAKDGLEALDRVRSAHFDAILSDVNMPRMSGVEFFRELLLEDRDVAKRFIFFSASQDAEFKELIHRYDVARLDKPSSMKEVISTVERIVAKATRRATRF